MYPNLDYSALGSRIRRAREAKQFTQEQLGEVCGLSNSYIGHIERGTRIPSIDTLYKISCALDSNIDSLLADSKKLDENWLSNLTATLKGKDKQKLNAFLKTVRVLADHIDEL